MATHRLGTRTAIDDANRVATLAAARPLSTTTVVGTGTHDLVSDFHTASGLTAGHVLQALTGTTFGFAASPVTAHALLSVSHNDTSAAAVVRGDLITGQGETPVWARLALGGASGSFVTRDASDVLWSTLTLPNAATANYVLYASGTNAVGTSSAIQISGGNLGFFGATPAAQSTGWSVTAGYTPLKAFDPAASTENELLRFVATLADYMKSIGLIGA